MEKDVQFPSYMYLLLERWVESVIQKVFGMREVPKASSHVLYYLYTILRLEIENVHRCGAMCIVMYTPPLVEQQILLKTRDAFSFFFCKPSREKKMAKTPSSGAVC